MSTAPRRGGEAVDHAPRTGLDGILDLQNLLRDDTQDLLGELCGRL